MKKALIVLSVFVLLYSANENWTLLTPRGTPPSGRWGAASVYDSIADRFIVWGGGTWSGVYNDLYALDSTATGSGVWRQLTQAGPIPSARGLMAYVYDAPRRRMIIFCGYNMAGSCFNDVYFLDSMHTANPRWTYASIGGSRPLNRQSSAAAYDPIRQRMIVFSGWCGFTWFNDIYAIENLASTPVWRLLSPAGTGPGGRWGAICSYDPVKDRLIVFGGQNSGQTYPNDVWALESLQVSNGRWRLLSTTGTRPTGRMWSTSTYDIPNDRMLFFGGGYFQSSQFNDLWALNMSSTPAAWLQINPTGTIPGARYGPCSALDASRRRLIVFGGYGGIDYNDVYTLTWTVNVNENRTPAITRSTFSVRPNPFRRYTTISYVSSKNSGSRVTVFDFQGRIVKTISPSNATQVTQIVWNGRDNNGCEVPAGTYFIVVNRSEGKIVKRIIKIK